jgi:hypothetical protein
MGDGTGGSGSLPKRETRASAWLVISRARGLIATQSALVRLVGHQLGIRSRRESAYQGSSIAVVVDYYHSALER